MDQKGSAAVSARAGAPLPEHLVALPGGEWAMWRCIGLRGAGFPVTLVSTLATTCTELADRVWQAGEQAGLAQNDALEILRREIEKAAEDQRDRLVKAIRRVKKGKLPAWPKDTDPPVEQALETFRTACAEVQAVRANYHQAFENEMRLLSRAIRQVAQMERFREALIWQNRRALHTGIEPLLNTSSASAPRNARQRLHQEMVASYSQRYCVKNDTIGFFGPIGWGKAVDQGAGITARPGPNLVAARKVYFEQWCIDVLAETLGRNRLLKPWMPPRCSPFIGLVGTTLYRPSASPTRLTPEQARVLQACDGEQTAKQIAQELTQAPDCAFTTEEQVYCLLDDFCTRGLILWDLQVPFEQIHPEQKLRHLLERIQDQDLRQQSLEPLMELETAAHTIARAAGNAERLDRAMEDLEETFTRLTGAAPTRAAGKTYAARTLVYEDCRRDLELEIGPELLQSLGPPLTLLLASARWLTFETAAAYQKVFHQAYAELAQRLHPAAVDVPSFWSYVRPLLFGENKPIDQTVMPVFQERWATILSFPAAQHHVVYSADALRGQVLAAFQAPGPGWRLACHHSPDVMIAAEDLAAIQRGDYALVLGELHVAMNALRASCLMSQHPSPGEMLRAFDLDVRRPGVAPVTPRDWPEVSSRTLSVFVSPQDHRLMFTPDACGIPPARALAIGALVVEDTEHGLCVCSRDGRVQIDIIEFFGEALSQVAVDSFKILRPADHTPRLSIDRLVICREAWRFAATEIPFAHEPVEADRFVAARHWAHIHRMPRHVFVKAPTEAKPFYVDFASPILINTFAKAVRRAIEQQTRQPITIAEMLPAPHQVWLPDADGQHYTCELRIVAVDCADDRSLPSKR